MKNVFTEEKMFKLRGTFCENNIKKIGADI